MLRSVMALFEPISCPPCKELARVESILRVLKPHEQTLLANDDMPLRHYRAKKGNLSDAIRKIKLTLKWEKEVGVEDIKRYFDKRNGINTESSPKK